MSRFEEIGLKWGDKEYKVAPDHVMGLIESIESVITMEEINHMLATRGIKRAQVSRAYRAALNYAGANVSTEDVYNSFFGASQDMLENTVNIMVGLLAMMIPPEHLRSKVNPQENTKKKTVKKVAAVSKSSAKRTKPR